MTLNPRDTPPSAWPELGNRLMATLGPQVSARVEVPYCLRSRTHAHLRTMRRCCSPRSRRTQHAHAHPSVESACLSQKHQPWRWRFGVVTGVSPNRQRGCAPGRQAGAPVLVRVPRQTGAHKPNARSLPRTPNASQGSGAVVGVCVVLPKRENRRDGGPRWGDQQLRVPLLALQVFTVLSPLLLLSSSWLLSLLLLVVVVVVLSLSVAVLSWSCCRAPADDDDDDDDDVCCFCLYCSGCATPCYAHFL